MQSQQNTTFSTKTKGHFALLFPELEALDVKDISLRQLAMLMVEEEPQGQKYSKCISNGLAIFSQFLAHDITFEVTSNLSGGTDLHLLQNERTVNLDLDCVYGQRNHSFYYDQEDGDKLLLGKSYRRGSWQWHDLQRNSQGVAIIGDARNDENLIVAGMQVLFIRFHNKLVDHLRAAGETENIFRKAKRLAIWYYHWLIIHEYLKKMLDPEVFQTLMTQGCIYYTYPFYLPLEFSGAAFRIGHSQVREQVRLNSKTEKELFELGTFAAVEDYIDWNYQFDFDNGKVQWARRLDTHIPKSFESIPFIRSEDEFERSLPYRNLRRSSIYGLPSGEAVAYRLGYKPIKVEETKALKMEGTPLWFYILREAQELGNGEHLGPVGSTILGECFFSIMEHDYHSFMKLHPQWQPDLGSELGKFDFTDFIRFIES